MSFDFPSSSQVYGPSQVEGAINQDTEISSQLTLWGQQGSEVIMGNLLVMPIEDSLLYVQPVYLQSSQTALPQLKRVIVFYRATTPAGVGAARRRRPARGHEADAGREPGGGLRVGAGGGRRQRPGRTPAASRRRAERRHVRRPRAQLIERANGQFKAAQEALKAGDWAEYGRQIDAPRADPPGAAARTLAVAPRPADAVAPSFAPIPLRSRRALPSEPLARSEALRIPGAHPVPVHPGASFVT